MCFLLVHIGERERERENVNNNIRRRIICYYYYRFYLSNFLLVLLLFFTIGLNVSFSIPINITTRGGDGGAGDIYPGDPGAGSDNGNITNITLSTDFDNILIETGGGGGGGSNATVNDVNVSNTGGDSNGISGNLLHSVSSNEFSIKTGLGGNGAMFGWTFTNDYRGNTSYNIAKGGNSGSVDLTIDSLSTDSFIIRSGNAGKLGLFAYTSATTPSNGNNFGNSSGSSGNIDLKINDKLVIGDNGAFSLTSGNGGNGWGNEYIKMPGGNIITSQEYGGIGANSGYVKLEVDELELLGNNSGFSMKSGDSGKTNTSSSHYTYELPKGGNSGNVELEVNKLYTSNSLHFKMGVEGSSYNSTSGALGQVIFSANKIIFKWSASNNGVINIINELEGNNQTYDKTLSRQLGSISLGDITLGEGGSSPKSVTLNIQSSSSGVNSTFSINNITLIGGSELNIIKLASKEGLEKYDITGSLIIQTNCVGITAPCATNSAITNKITRDVDDTDTPQLSYSSINQYLIFDIAGLDMTDNSYTSLLTVEDNALRIDEHVRVDIMNNNTYALLSLPIILNHNANGDKSILATGIKMEGFAGTKEIGQDKVYNVGDIDFDGHDDYYLYKVMADANSGEIYLEFTGDAASECNYNGTNGKFNFNDNDSPIIFDKYFGKDLKLSKTTSLIFKTIELRIGNKTTSCGDTISSENDFTLTLNGGTDDVKLIEIYLGNDDALDLTARGKQNFIIKTDDSTGMNKFSVKELIIIGAENTISIDGASVGKVSEIDLSDIGELSFNLLGVDLTNSSKLVLNANNALKINEYTDIYLINDNSGNYTHDLNHLYSLNPDGSTNNRFNIDSSINARNLLAINIIGDHEYDPQHNHNHDYTLKLNEDNGLSTNVDITYTYRLLVN
jgi:hypothetical protein